MTPADLVIAWRTQAADYLRQAKHYTCAHNRDIRAGYLKASLQLTECADQLAKCLKDAASEPR